MRQLNWTLRGREQADEEEESDDVLAEVVHKKDDDIGLRRRHGDEHGERRHRRRQSGRSHQTNRHEIHCIRTAVSRPTRSSRQTATTSDCLDRHSAIFAARSHRSSVVTRLVSDKRCKE